MNKRDIFLVLLFFLSACVSLQNLQPTQEEVTALQSKTPELTFESLQNGYKLYVQKCSNCHRLHDPAKYNLGEGQPLLIKMFKKAKISSDNEKKLINLYIAAKRDFVKK